MKIGLYFGTFNPIHIGHLIVANYMATQTDLEEVWLVVSPHNPLKEKSELLDENSRLGLVKIAIEGNQKLKACDVEFSLPQPSYTYQTLKHLNNKYPTKNFVLIMGEDNLCNFDKWKNYEEILEDFEVYVYPRELINDEQNRSNVNKEHPNVQFFNCPTINLSSTLIREQVEKGKDVKYLLPENINDEIKKRGYYQAT